MKLNGQAIKNVRKELKVSREILAEMLRRVGLDCVSGTIQRIEQDPGYQPKHAEFWAEKLALTCSKKKEYFLIENRTEIFK